MATRTRTTGSYNGSNFYPTMSIVDSNGNVTNSYARPGHSVGPVFPHGMITDVIGSPGVPHDVFHDKYVMTGCGPGDVVTVNSKVPYSGNETLRFRTNHPLSVELHSQASHLGALSGIKALAVARVPAYASAELNAFISLAEARSIVDTSAVLASRALARLAFTTYKSLRTSGGRAQLGREVHRSLQRVLLKPPGKHEDTFKSVLGLLTGAASLDMEWKYGWAPMLKDMQALNVAQTKLVNLRQRLLDGVRVYGRASDVRVRNFNTLSVIDNDYEGWIGGFILQGVKTTKTTAVASIVRKLNPSSPMYDVDWFTSLDVVAEVNGLTPSLKSIWQLSSLTFITDWFWNVASLLESLETLDAPIGSSFTSSQGLYSLKQETTVIGGGFTQAAKAVEPHNREGVCKHLTYTRNLDSLTGVPLLYVPPLTLPTKAGQWFSMAEIAFVNYVKRKR